VAGISAPRDIALGFRHTCALDGGGRLLCWGANGGGFHNFGNERTTSVWEATPFGDQVDAIAVELDENHGCLVLSNRRMQCWGMNYWGTLGDGRSQSGPQNRLTDVLDMERITDVGVGFGHTCALRSDGVVFCWGANGVGELGDGTTEIRYEPIAVEGIPKAIALGTGPHHTCVVSEAGQVWCWGWGDRGFTDRIEDTPRLIEGVGDAIDVADGAGFTCVLTGTGEVWCWGTESSPFGEFPARIFESARKISAGSTHACALLEGGEIRCAGFNNSGQLDVPAEP